MGCGDNYETTNSPMRLYVFVIVLLLSVATSAQETCPHPLDTDQDGIIGINDMLSLLSVFGDSDMDFDGVWDSVDPCVGSIDECGVCNGPGAIYDCGCYDTLLDGSCCGGTIEYEGEMYSTVQIGSQCWFVENLGYNPLNSDWGDQSWEEPRTYELPAELQDSTMQGARYNFLAARDLDLCPPSWRVPNDGDFQSLFDFLSNELPGLAGSALKDANAWSIWGENEGMDIFGFSAIPMNDFTNEWQAESYWWLSDGPPFTNGHVMYIVSYSDNLNYYEQMSATYPLAIRCMRD